MDEVLGSLCIVLHCHLPYLLHHGSGSHGVNWLYEAAAECYLPLLDLIGETALHKARPALTVGLTPVLLEQLAHDDFKSGLVAFLQEKIQHAQDDQRQFNVEGDAHLVWLAERWQGFYTRQLEHFERIDRDIPAQFAARAAEKQIELLCSAATHAYLPLLSHDQMIQAQIRCGQSAAARHLPGISTTGFWLPECGYRPATDDWTPPAGSPQTPRHRPGFEAFLAPAGLTHFFVESNLVRAARPLGVIEAGQFRETVEEQLHWDSTRGWNDPLEPVGVESILALPRCFAFARHPRVSEQVWSSSVGYPGSREYLDFHRKHGLHGLRYHRVTGASVSLGDKQPYEPDDVFSKLFEHTQHFARIVRDALAEHKRKTGRAGVCIAAFDAELFGHWWFEGPQFLRDVIFTCAHDKSIDLRTSSEVLQLQPPDKIVRMPEGSWGKNYDASVWLNEETRWMWEVEYRAEQRFLQLLGELPWRAHPAIQQLLERAGRELLLLQASDWPFGVHAGAAKDYAIQRFSGHATRFDRAADIAISIAQGHALAPLEKAQLAEIDLHDSLFPDIDLNWWG